MAKRRRLEAPSNADLNKIEEEFRRETSHPESRRSTPPIAQVAAETAESLNLGDPTARVAQARDKADAEKLREAQSKGLIMLDIPLSEIDADSMVRDRSMMDAEPLDELRKSILKNGMRLPIEVYELPAKDGQGPRFGLLSGYRRMHVVRAIHDLMGPGHFDTIRAILREPGADADRFAAMVEENEIRQSLSHYERGRIAAIAAKQGVFENTEAAVAAMFPVASKAKRSKIRSFAMIFEELGDILEFPENLREKDGLRIAAGLRDGAENRLREALATGQGHDPASEWALIEATLNTLEASPDRKSRGGRPKMHVPPAGWAGDNTVRLSNGIILRKDSNTSGYTIHISGTLPPTDVVDRLFEQVQYLLEKP